MAYLSTQPLLRRAKSNVINKLGLDIQSSLVYTYCVRLIKPKGRKNKYMTTPLLEETDINSLASLAYTIAMTCTSGRTLDEQEIIAISEAFKEALTEFNE